MFFLYLGYLNLNRTTESCPSLVKLSFSHNNLKVSLEVSTKGSKSHEVSAERSIHVDKILCLLGGVVNSEICVGGDLNRASARSLSYQSMATLLGDILMPKEFNFILKKTAAMLWHW